MGKQLGKMDHNVFNVQQRDNLLTMVTYFDDMYEALKSARYVMDGMDLNTLDQIRKDNKESNRYEGGIPFGSLLKHGQLYKNIEELIEILNKRLYHQG